MVNLKKVITENHQNLKSTLDVFLSTIDKYSSFFLFFSAFAYKIILDIIYIKAIGPRYEYLGMPLAANAIKYIVAWCLYIALLLFLPKGEKSISNFFLFFQLAFTIAPMLVFYSLSDQKSSFMFLVIFTFILQIVLLKPTKRKISGIKIPGLSPYVTVFAFIFIFLTFLMAILWNGFFGSNAFDVNFLYRIRETASYPKILNYFLTWCHAIFVPFFILLSLENKKYISCFALILVEIGFFMTLGHKVILLRLFVVLGIYFLVRAGRPIKFLFIGLSIGFAIILIMFSLENKTVGLPVYLNDYIAQRALFYPSKLKFVYYDFFSEYARAGFSEGQIGKIFGLTYPFTGTIGQTVASFLKGGKFFSENAVTGYLGESYAQAGAFGLISMSFVLAAFIKFIDECIGKEDINIFLPCMGLLAITINDASVLTSMLNGGFVFIAIFAMVYSHKKTLVIDRSLQK